MPGGEHANPVIADWDGDGNWDIVTGTADGGVYWYRNAGRRGRPEFEAPVTLVAKHEGIGYSELLEPGRDPKPGIRSQIAVTDYDGDGKLDVLLGDFCTYLQMRTDLTPEQTRRLQGTPREGGRGDQVPARQHGGAPCEVQEGRHEGRPAVRVEHARELGEVAGGVPRP